MSTQEKILNTLQALELEPEELKNFGYRFKHQDREYIWIPDEEDEDYLCLAIPEVVSTTNVSENVLYQITDTINATMKYVKTNTLGDSLWLFYERQLFGNDEDLQLTITRMTSHLNTSLALLNNVIGNASRNIYNTNQG